MPEIKYSKGNHAYTCMWKCFSVFYFLLKYLDFWSANSQYIKQTNDLAKQLVF